MKTVEVLNDVVTGEVIINGIAIDSRKVDDKFMFIAYKGNMKKRLQKANQSGATHVVFIDRERWSKGEAEIKCLRNGEQRLLVPIDGELVGVRQEQASDLVEQVGQWLQIDDYAAHPRGEDSFMGPYDYADRMYVRDR